jgi:hypothetical protein
VPSDAALACLAGLSVGGVTATEAYLSYARTTGRPWAAVSIIPISVLVVGAGRTLLARWRQRRASDWLALGYAAAAVLATLVLTLEEAARRIFEVPAW